MVNLKAEVKKKIFAVGKFSVVQEENHFLMSDHHSSARPSYKSIICKTEDIRIVISFFLGTGTVEFVFLVNGKKCKILKCFMTAYRGRGLILVNLN